MKAVSPETQKVFDFQMAAGRFFGPEDTARSEPVVVVNEAFARLTPQTSTVPRRYQGRIRRMEAFVGIDVAFATLIPICICVWHNGSTRQAGLPEIPRGSGNRATIDPFIVTSFASEVAKYLRALERRCSKAPNRRLNGHVSVN
jgi:hypothetical protein